MTASESFSGASLPADEALLTALQDVIDRYFTHTVSRVVVVELHRLLHLLAHFPQPEGTGHAPGTEATGA